jgi:hypothetical protein
MYSSAAHERDYEKAMAEKLSPSPSCLKCSHYKVCTIARNIGPMMDQFYGMLRPEDQPFSGHEIAKLCKWYEHKLEEND